MQNSNPASLIPWRSSGGKPKLANVTVVSNFSLIRLCSVASCHRDAAMVSTFVETTIWRRVARVSIVVRLRTAYVTDVSLAADESFSPINLFSMNCD